MITATAASNGNKKLRYGGSRPKAGGGQVDQHGDYKAATGYPFAQAGYAGGGGPTSWGAGGDHALDILASIAVGEGETNEADDLAVAFAMGRHRRVGRDSLVAQLDSETIKRIMELCKTSKQCLVQEEPGMSVPMPPGAWRFAGMTIIDVETVADKQEFLRIQKTMLGDRDPRIAHSYNHIGEVLFMQVGKAVAASSSRWLPCWAPAWCAWTMAAQKAVLSCAAHDKSKVWRHAHRSTDLGLLLWSAGQAQGGTRQVWGRHPHNGAHPKPHPSPVCGSRQV